MDSVLFARVPAVTPQKETLGISLGLLAVIGLSTAMTVGVMVWYFASL